MLRENLHGFCSLFDPERRRIFHLHAELEDQKLLAAQGRHGIMTHPPNMKGEISVNRDTVVVINSANLGAQFPGPVIKVGCYYPVQVIWANFPANYVTIFYSQMAAN